MRQAIVEEAVRREAVRASAPHASSDPRRLTICFDRTQRLPGNDIGAPAANPAAVHAADHRGGTGSSAAWGSETPADARASSAPSGAINSGEYCTGVMVDKCSPDDYAKRLRLDRGSHMMAAREIDRLLHLNEACMKMFRTMLAVAGIGTVAACSGVPTDVRPAEATLAPRYAAGGNSGPSAGGGGHFEITGDLRTFSFTAITERDGSVKGQAQLYNRDQDVRLHMDIDCLRVVGNIAYASGVITQSTTPAQVGLRGVFSAQDNGEGANAAPDRLSLVFSAAFAANVCRTFSPAPTNAIDGNIQVKP